MLFIFLGEIVSLIFLIINFTCFIKFGFKLETGSFSKFFNLSSSAGLINVKQSLFLKFFVIISLLIFFVSAPSTSSEETFFKHSSKYSLGVKFPLSKLKSLKTHIKSGKKSPKSKLLFLSFDIFILFDKFAAFDNSSILSSDIAYLVLYIKQLLNNTDKVNIFISILLVLSFSTDPKPSQSITNNFVPFSNSIGFPQTHKPFVQAFIVAPTLNPSILFIIKFAKKLFPLLYGPVTHKTAIF